MVSETIDVAEEPKGKVKKVFVNLVVGFLTFLSYVAVFGFGILVGLGFALVAGGRL